jgi:alkylated DNA repair dioxygenase AlkB
VKPSYEEDFLAVLGIDPIQLLKTLLSSPDWFRPTAFGKEVKRRQLYVSEASQFGGNPKLKPGMAYYNLHATVKWSDVPAELTDIREKLNASYGCDFTFVSLLHYEDELVGIAPHKDSNTEGDWSYPIAGISLGTEREFWWATIKDYKTEYDKLRKQFAMNYAKSTAKTKAKEQVLLNVGSRLIPKQGSLYVMPGGFQQEHFHAILKSDEPCGNRVSLTFRVHPNGLAGKIDAK